MLSRWRKEVREGKIVAKTKDVELDPQTATALQRLRDVERAFTFLKEEHALLKKAIRFCSARRVRFLPSSTATERSTK
jgi:transposase